MVVQVHCTPEAARVGFCAGDVAVWALIEEAELTPKPALVDLRGSGAHRDLSVESLRRSARALRPCFMQMFETAAAQRPDQALREALAAIGRGGEALMLAATGGSNAHRGAIWSLGLLLAGAAVTRATESAEIARAAAAIARFPDRVYAASRAGGSSASSEFLSNGERACRNYGVPGARGEAMAAFPHVLRAGLPQLHSSRAQGATETEARLDALLAIMRTLADTCLLHRGGSAALETAQRGAARVLAAGGCASPAGRMALNALHLSLMRLNASPGGAADLLAAVLFLDRIAGGGPWK